MSRLENKYIKLINNVLVFGVGNIGSKVISFLMVSLYTNVFTTSEYGLYDLIIQIINLMIPFAVVGSTEAVLRFSLDNNERKETILSSSLLLTMIGFLVSLTFWPVISMQSIVGDYAYAFYILVFLNAIYAVLRQFVKGLQYSKVYVISDFINIFVQLLFSFIFLKVYNLGMTGCLSAIMIGYITAIIFMILRVKIYKFISIVSINKKFLKVMLIYSIPLMPNSILWWITGSSNRFVLNYFLGLSASGIYAVASKIPSVISMFSTVVFQAWQISAVEEYESKSKSEFYTKIFNLCSYVIFTGIAVILTFIKPIMRAFVSSDFYIAWMYVPFLLIGSLFAALQSFVGTSYMAAKRTFGALLTTLCGAIFNIVMNLTLVPFFGVYGVAISTMASYLLVFIVRFLSTQKYVRIKLDITAFVVNFGVIFLEVFLLYQNKSTFNILNIILMSVLCIFNIILINKITHIDKLFKNKFLKQKQY